MKKTEIDFTVEHGNGYVHVGYGLNEKIPSISVSRDSSSDGISDAYERIYEAWSSVNLNDDEIGRLIVALEVCREEIKIRRMIPEEVKHEDK
jgi:hypothetical protein